MNTIMHKKQSVWQLQKAKAHFSEVINHALAGEPQLVTRRGLPSVYIIDAVEYDAEKSNRGLDRKKILVEAPHTDMELDLSRNREDDREFSL